MDQEELETFESAIEFYPKEVKEKILLNQRYNVPELTGLKRRLLVEKHTPYILFSEMLLDIISDLTVLIDNKMYPQQIFYFKKDICAFIYHSDENYLSVRESITQKLNLIFTGGVSDLEVTNKYKIYREIIEKNFKLKRSFQLYTILISHCVSYEQHFKSSPLTAMRLNVKK